MADREEISLLEEIQRLAEGDPFVPFAIVMASGHRYDISSRDGVMVGRSVIIVMPHGRGHQMLRNAQISEVILFPGDAP